MDDISQQECFVLKIGDQRDVLQILRYSDMLLIWYRKELPLPLFKAHKLYHACMHAVCIFLSTERDVRSIAEKLILFRSS